MPTATAIRPTSRALPSLPGRLPASFEGAPAPIAKLAAEFSDLRERADAVRRNLADLERRAPEAAAADRRALAEAHRAGNQDPGDEHVEALANQIEEARREAQGLTDACLASWQEFKATFAASAEKWNESSAVQYGKLRNSVVDEMDDLAGLLTTAAELKAKRTWIAEARKAIAGDVVGESGIRRRFPQPRASAGTSIQLGRNQFQVEQVLAALRNWLDA